MHKMKNKLSHARIRQSIKQNDFQELIQRLTVFAKKHSENLLMIGIGVVIVSILIPLYFKQQRGNEMRAMSLYNRANSINDQGISSDPERIAQGDFRSLEEKYRKVEEAYAEIIDNYRSSRVAGLAKLGKANALFYRKKYPEAMELYQTLLGSAKEPLMQISIRNRIAACLESLGNWEAALSSYQKILTDHPGAFNHAELQLATARCQLRLGQLAGAKAIWANLAKDKNSGFWGEIARQALVQNP
jgi:tetratricopeptide (TPR) repeat protein